MYIVSSALLTSLGEGKQAHLNAIKNQKTGLSNKTEFHRLIPGVCTYLGEVAGVESVVLPLRLQSYFCRNNQLAWLTMQVDGFAKKVSQVVEQVGSLRVGLVVGTSTSGIAETEGFFKSPENSTNFRYQTTHQIDSLAQFCCDALHLKGPRFVISTACSSSAKVFTVAKRWLDAGLVDAVVVGGVDSLCLTAMYGFNALGLVSETLCKPLDEKRDGINIGEAGGFMLLANQPIFDEPLTECVQIAGVGESSDAYHIATPHPEGKGACQAMRNAITQAGVSIADIDYLNLHGTATVNNDVSELSGIANLLAGTVRERCLWISSTKGITGHTLGASGITETIFCQWALEEQMILPNRNLKNVDRAILDKTQAVSVIFPKKVVFLPDLQKQDKMTCVMSNSFGFGGNNASVLLTLGAENEG
ncbi:3-oxoacyl-[ACP] synthase FabV like [hydrothermal vent metagenome]|uniref:3-oxoacyl-[ACP] synthase FabV like n=1 Tax=hydrothermal vent metagenome TaxID=652676 RepID=A0A3B0W105_9ZZZZ